MTNFYLFLSRIIAVDVGLFLVNVNHCVKQYEESSKPEDEANGAAPVAAKGIAATPPLLVLFFGEPIWVTVFVSSFLIKEFTDRNACKYTCNKTSQVTPVVYLRVSVRALV